MNGNVTQAGITLCSKQLKIKLEDDDELKSAARYSRETNLLY